MPCRARRKPDLKLDLRFGGGRQKAALLQAQRTHGRLNHLHHLFGVHGFGVQDQIEPVAAGAVALPDMLLYWARWPASSSREQLAGRGALQAAVQHEIADAHGIRRHDMHAQRAGELAREHLRAGRAVHQVVFGGQARQDGRDQIGAGPSAAPAGLRAEFAFDESLNSRLIDQLEPEAVRARCAPLLRTGNPAVRKRRSTPCH